MRNFILLLVLLTCFVAYMRAEQPATWNSWMAQLGATNLNVAVVPNDPEAAAADAATDAPAAPHIPPPPAPGTIPVGGLIKNGNFLAAGGNWEGDAEPSGNGLVIRLNPSSWTRVYQTFPGDQGTQYTIEIAYRLSPGLTLSTDPADYTDIGKRVQLPGYEHYTLQPTNPGYCFGTVGDPNSKGVSYEYYRPKPGSTDVQYYQHTYPPVEPLGNMTFGLAFPPGTGTVTLVSAYVKDN